jgi:hypothetical protein
MTICQVKFKNVVELKTVILSKAKDPMPEGNTHQK